VYPPVTALPAVMPFTQAGWRSGNQNGRAGRLACHRQRRLLLVD